MYKILIAGPDNTQEGVGFDINEEMSKFFQDGRANIYSSMNPDDIEDCDAVIVPGGLPDVSAEYWGEKNIPCTHTDEDLDRQQYAMIFRAVSLRKPIFCPCRGMQLMVVLHGGSLIQDIEGTDAHTFIPGEPKVHSAVNVPGSFLHNMYGDRMIVNSGHHQAIKRMPKNFRIAQFWCATEEKEKEYLARIEAGELEEVDSECIIEAVYQVDYPLFGVQWHPELNHIIPCGDTDVTKIRDYFYQMIEDNKQ